MSASGEYLGGVISPGVEISIEALTERAAALPKVRLEPPRAAIGKGTREAIQSGVIYGYAGQVDGLLARLREELATRPRRSPPAAGRTRSSRTASRSTSSTTC